MRLRLLTLLFVTTLTGCGYHQAGSATHIPANVRTLAVPIFATNAQAYHTEMAFTQAIIRELNTRTKYQIINNDSHDADATLHGTILTQTVAPLTYDASTGQSSSYSIATTPSSTASSTNPPRTSAASSRKTDTPSNASPAPSPRPS
jgi:outer membrane lipopolysaccharide assembly protein LptE/RlpB